MDTAGRRGPSGGIRGEIGPAKLGACRTIFINSKPQPPFLTAIESPLSEGLHGVRKKTGTVIGGLSG